MISRRAQWVVCWVTLLITTHLAPFFLLKVTRSFSCPAFDCSMEHARFVPGREVFYVCTKRVPAAIKHPPERGDHFAAIGYTKGPPCCVVFFWLWDLGRHACCRSDGPAAHKLRLVYATGGAGAVPIWDLSAAWTRGLLIEHEQGFMNMNLCLRAVRANKSFRIVCNVLYCIVFSCNLLPDHPGPTGMPARTQTRLYGDC